MDYTKPENLLTLIKAIRAKCLDCTGGQAAGRDVEACTSVGCPLFFFRFGSNGWVDDEAKDRIVGE